MWNRFLQYVGLSDDSHWEQSMKIASVKINNLRSLRSIELPLSQSVCIVGENNAGKSSVLQALSIFINGPVLLKSDYFNESQDIRIAITFSGIEDDDLINLAETHRHEVRDIVKDGCITLVRCYGTDGKSRFKYETFTPVDDRFKEEKIDELIKGQRAGADFASRIIGQFPELGDRIDAKSTQG